MCSARIGFGFFKKPVKLAKQNSQLFHEWIVPRVFSLDPYGKFLFSAGLDSGKLRTYQIDESTGIPNHIYTNDLGREPMWILVTDLAG